MFVLKSKYRKLQERLEQAIEDKNFWYQKAQRVNNKPFGFQKVVEVDLFRLPKLSKSELRVLSICVNLIANQIAKDGQVSYSNIARFSRSQVQRPIQELITKGYLQRVKRGTYKLTFYK